MSFGSSSARDSLQDWPHVSIHVSNLRWSSKGASSLRISFLGWFKGKLLKGDRQLAAGLPFCENRNPGTGVLGRWGVAVLLAVVGAEERPHDFGTGDTVPCMYVRGRLSAYYALHPRPLIYNTNGAPRAPTHTLGTVRYHLLIQYGRRYSSV